MHLSIGTTVYNNVGSMRVQRFGILKIICEQQMNKMMAQIRGDPISRKKNRNIWLSLTSPLLPSLGKSQNETIERIKGCE